MTTKPSSDDRRGEQRFAFYRHVHLSTEGRRQQGLVQDLSITGMRLLCNSTTAKVGRQLLVTLPRPPQGGSVTVVARCKVTWRRSRAVGVRFINPPPSLRQHLSALLRWSRERGPRLPRGMEQRTTVWG